MIGYPDGTNILQKSLTKNVTNCDELGLELAQEMIQDGAENILAHAEKMAFKDEMPQRL